MVPHKVCGLQLPRLVPRQVFLVVCRRDPYNNVQCVLCLDMTRFWVLPR